MRHLLAVCVLLLGLTAQASAIYSPSLGRFVNRDPGVELSERGYVKINGIPGAHRVTRHHADPYGLLPEVYAGHGYQDGLNLYRGYFVPNHTDPTGLEPIPSEGSICTQPGRFDWSGWDKDGSDCIITCCCGGKEVGKIKGEMYYSQRLRCTKHPNQDDPPTWEVTRPVIERLMCKPHDDKKCETEFPGSKPCHVQMVRRGGGR